MTTARLSLCVWFLASAALMVSPAAGQTPALWTGGAGTASYNDPNNWDVGAVPVNAGGTTYSVTIPAGAAVEFDVDLPQEVTDLELGDGATLTVDSGKSLTVLDDAKIYGRVTTDNGIFSAPAAAAQFPGNTARAIVSGGGTIGIAATTYSATGWSSQGTYAILSATGAGSTLDLSSLQILYDNHNHWGNEQRHQVSATNSGVIDLSSLQQVHGPTRENNDWLEFVVNTGGDILLTSLQSTATAGAGEVRFSLNVPSYTLPALTDTTNTRFILAEAMTLHLPVIQSHSGRGYTLGDNTTVDAPLLESLTWSDIQPGTGSAFNAPNLVDISGSVINVSPAWTLTNGVIGTLNNARLTVSGGAQFGVAYGDVSATSYASTGITWGGTEVLFSATGPGSVLDLSSLLSLADNHSTYGGAQVHQICATNDGLVNLSSVQQVSGPTLEESDRLEFVVSTGGNIVLSALQSTTAGTGEVRFSIDVPAYALPALQTAVNTQFNVSGTRTLNLPVLVSHNGQGYALGDGATVTAPTLASLTNAVLTLGTGSVFDAPNLVDISGTKMDLSPGRTVTMGVIGTLNNARISVSGGITFGTAYGDVSATSYASTGITWGGTEVLFSATGPGSVLDLSSLLSLADNHSTYGGAQVHQISATNDGLVNLSSVQQVSGPTLEESDRLEFVVSTGGNIVLSALQSTTAGTGEVRFSIDVPAYALPALQTAVNTQFNVSGTRTLNLPQLASHNGQGYGLGDAATVHAPALTSLTNAVLTAGAGAVFDAPNLTDISGSVINVSPAWTLTSGVIGTMNNARLTVSGGAQFGVAYGDVSATAYSSTGLLASGTYTILGASGTGSVLDLSSLTALADNYDYYGNAQVHQVLATDNGLVNLSSVQDIAGPLRESIDRLDFIANSGGHIDLSSLQSVTAGNGQVRFLVSAGGQLTMGEVTISNQMTVDVTDDTSLLEFVGGLHLDPTSSLNVRGGAKVRIGGNFSFAYTDEARLACDTAIFEFDGTGEQWMEVGGADLGLPGPGAGNFGITQLIVGTETQATTVVLVDLIDNGNRASNEALYLYGSGGLDGLRIPGESTLLIGDINVYALVDGQMEHLNAWFGPGITRVEYDQGWVVLPEPATLALLAVGGLALLGQGRRRQGT